jgi:hypothetical protein
MEHETAAILTGDIVGSRQAGPEGVAAVFDALAAALEDAAAWTGGPARLTRFRGDGWQALVPDGPRALRCALFLRARLLTAETAETRIAIGLGGISSAGTSDLSDADGAAFHASGAALDAMARGRRLVLAAEGAPPLAPAVAELCDALARGWSLAQAEVVAPRLAPDAPSQAALAERLGIRQQSVADRLEAAGLPAIEAALEAVEAALA